VNQKPVESGGRWNLLGTFHFAEGTNSYVRVTDAFADAGQVVLADAIKFLYIPPVVAPTIVAHPQSQTAKIGKTAVFAAQADGTQPLDYQWYFNGEPLPGAVDGSYSRANVTIDHAGVYSLMVSNAVGSAVSSNAVLTVIPPLAARIDSIISLPDGGVRLEMRGDPEFHYAVDVSTNFLDWTALATLAATNTTFEYIDATSTNGLRYYRLRGE
jgi:hypothetical protein